MTRAVAAAVLALLIGLGYLLSYHPLRRVAQDCPGFDAAFPWTFYQPAAWSSRLYVLRRPMQHWASFCGVRRLSSLSLKNLPKAIQQLPARESEARCRDLAEQRDP